MLKSHTLVPDQEYSEILYELRPVLGPDGEPVEGLHNAWITLNNPG
ncbi:MAG: 6-oxocyclohex-1-ene-1-carbonyl-CoA hydratase, partial [Gemmatimonadetes bacterium]|nr:6-oxocyclohex-1-ene-1-carbonyl-CoA hydratase [Gammaproteobacteria bacterium]NIS01284.1 6-oxocyclohex-1-ene-1-carbonyl-CoA hydratase [Gemmatimonadota bacterium]NIU51663.1 6-oxocyclohex-1-ene-1-carbonyl-CoA hydratase [Gemmatimonadota bacterium]NIW35463.1 6-oxocyclohex-1-ene-1-carbonyl-CoA hydratase [Gemmatimonadota bacterium]NIY08310.1 6-oxocyclohex-1-ene-1-carbonyl-CoA hydratase [Gemmatimonadota bacterium]